MPAPGADRERFRWLLVAVAAAVMGAAGTYQFVWSTISGAVGARVTASPAALGTIFTVYIVAQTAVQFPAGSIRDRYGPQWVLALGGVFLFAGYAGLGLAGNYLLAVVAYGLGGIGSGMAYTVAVNTPVKWFTDRRGLATGVVTTAFAAGSVVVIPLVRARVGADYTTTLVLLGLAVGSVGLLGALVIRDPPRARHDEGDATPVENGGTSAVDVGGSVGWRTVVGTWQFWVFYVVMLVVDGVGLMLIGQSVGFTRGLGLSSATATTVASVVALADALGVIVMSTLSDRFGGERTVGVSLVLGGCSLGGAILVGLRGLSPVFVLLVAGTAFFRSPVFAIFPSLVGRYYGRARSSENYALVYSAKVPGGVFGGTVTGLMVAALGWPRSFAIGAVLLALAGLLAFTLRPNERMGESA